MGNEKNEDATFESALKTVQEKRWLEDKDAAAALLLRRISERRVRVNEFSLADPPFGNGVRERLVILSETQDGRHVRVTVEIG